VVEPETGRSGEEDRPHQLALVRHETLGRNTPDHNLGSIGAGFDAGFGYLFSQRRLSSSSDWIQLDPELISCRKTVNGACADRIETGFHR